MNETMWLIIAPSCIGKTTFIQQNTRLAEITGLLDKPPVYPAGEYYKNVVDHGHDVINHTAYLHCCLSYNISFEFYLNSPINKQAIVLVASKETRKKRANHRHELWAKGKDVARPVTVNRTFTDEQWASLYYRGVTNLEDIKIPYILLDAEKDRLPAITKEEMIQFLGVEYDKKRYQENS